MNQYLAQITNPALPPALGKGGKEAGGAVIGAFVSSLIGAIFILAFLLTFFFLLVGGLQWLTSSGDKTNLESARNKITHAIMGLLIVGAVWAIMVLVGQFLGLDFTKEAFKLPIPTIDRGTP